ncbi:hypothetical protein D3C81_2062110 [compost metagenome]
MEPQIGGLVDDIAVISAVGGILGSNDGLDRLFAELFQNLVQAFVVQAGHVGTVRFGAFARFQHFGQAGQGVAHVSVLRCRWRGGL